MKKGLIWATLAVLAVVWIRSTRQSRDQSYALCAELEKLSDSKQSAVVRGTFVESNRRVLELREAQWVSGEGARPIQGRVMVAGKPPSAEFHTRYEFLGQCRCLAELRNPSRAQDFWRDLGLPSLRCEVIRTIRRLPDAGFGIQLREWWVRRWEENFANSPGLLALQRSVWLGNNRDLGEPLLTFFLEAGLLPVLALSGQHVVILTWLVGFGWKLCARSLSLLRLPPVGLAYYRIKQLIPVFVALILLVLSAGESTVHRAAGMTLFRALLRFRRIHCSLLQWVGSSLGLLCLVNPTLLGDVSFLLSAIATALVIVIAETETPRDFLWQLFLMTLGLPVLMWPVSALFFGKISLLAPFYGAVLGSLWELVLIPASYFLGLSAFFIPLGQFREFTSIIERGWHFLSAWQLGLAQGVGSGYLTVPRPTWWEFLIIEIGLLWAGKAAWRAITTARGGASRYEEMVFNRFVKDL